jgi:hypothetical protein
MILRGMILMARGQEFGPRLRPAHYVDTSLQPDRALMHECRTFHPVRFEVRSGWRWSAVYSQPMLRAFSGWTLGDCRPPTAYEQFLSELD